MTLTYTKRFSLKKNGPNSPKFEEKEKFKLPILYDEFQQVVKNIEGFCLFFTFISNM
jgi:hypothetical protein